MYVNDMEQLADCREEDLGRGAPYARPGYPPSSIDAMRSGIPMRDDRSRAMIPPSASQTSYGGGRI